MQGAAFSDGTRCNDGDINTDLDTCTDGVCAGRNLCGNVTCTTEACHEFTTCSRGRCIPGVALSDFTRCDDGVVATDNDICLDGLCSGVDLCIGVTCRALTQCHVPGTCFRGNCSTPLKATGSPCDDGLPTTNDRCAAGVWWH